MLSAFGVDDGRISKGNPGPADVHVPTVLVVSPSSPSKAERRRKALQAGAIGGSMSAVGGAALRLKKVPLAVTAGVSGIGSAAQSLASTRPPKKRP